MKVSIIIPSYNEEKYIKFCLDSLLCQSLKPLEIIVVDHSTDKTWQIVSNYPSNVDGIKIKKIRMKDLGPGNGPAKSRNLGARNAKGEILAFLDADMKYDEKYLEKLVRPIIKKEALATFTKEEYVANSDNVWSKCWSINSYLPFSRRIEEDRSNEATTFRAIKKDLFRKTKGYIDLVYAEDTTILGPLGQLPDIKAKVAKGAICYHFNPGTLGEVFSQALWMGGGEKISRSLRTVLSYSFPNSLRRGILETSKYKIPEFLIFKIVFDFGMFVGFFKRLLREIIRDINDEK